jgi:hypothetical protein
MQIWSYMLYCCLWWVVQLICIASWHLASISVCITQIQSLQLIEIMFKNWIFIAGQNVARNSNSIMLYRIVIAVCYGSHTTRIKALCVQNTEFLGVRQRYKYLITQILCLVILLRTTNKTQRYAIFFITANALQVSGGFSAHYQEPLYTRESLINVV